MNPSEPEFRILLVEDNPGDVFLFQEVLAQTKRKSRVDAIDCGRKAIQSLSEKIFSGEPLPHVIILDQHLPDIQGLDVLKWIKSQPHFAQIPVIMLTGSEDAADVQKAYENKAECYLVKPAFVQEFEEIISKIESAWFRSRNCSPSS